MPSFRTDGNLLSVRCFFICRHLLGYKDDEYDLNDLRRLNADARETIPCARADLVALAEEDKSDDEQNVEYRKINPLIGNKIGVNDREYDECADAEEHCKALDDDVFCPAVGACHTVDHDDAEDRAYHADSEKKNIRPFKKSLIFLESILIAAAALQKCPISQIIAA